MGNDVGFPQPQFSKPELVEPQDEGAQATYDPKDAIHSIMQLHCHEHDEHRVSGICVLMGEEEDCHGGAFFVEKGGIIHHEGKAIPTMDTREDGSLVEAYFCDAQQHGVVFDSHALHGPWRWRGPRVALVFYTRALREHMREADVAQLRSLAFQLV